MIFYCHTIFPLSWDLLSFSSHLYIVSNTHHQGIHMDAYIIINYYTTLNQACFPPEILPSILCFQSCSYTYTLYTFLSLTKCFLSLLSTNHTNMILYEATNKAAKQEVQPTLIPITTAKDSASARVDRIKSFL